MADWIKQIQSVGRGFRPGMMVHTMAAGVNTGKSVILDYESDDFTPWHAMMRPHYIQYRDYDTGETCWKKFKKLPKMADLAQAEHVIRHNKDGSYQYIKNRSTGKLGTVCNDEMAWIILQTQGY